MIKIGDYEISDWVFVSPNNNFYSNTPHYIRRIMKNENNIGSLGLRFDNQNENWNLSIVNSFIWEAYHSCYKTPISYFNDVDCGIKHIDLFLRKLSKFYIFI